MHGPLPPDLSPTASGYEHPALPLPLKMIAGLSTFCGWVAAGMIVSAVGITCQMIWVRWVLNQSTVWQTEAVVYLMIGATLIGLPYVQKSRGHVNVDALPRILPRGGRFFLAVLIKIIGLAIVGVMVWYGAALWYEAWDWNEKSDTIWGPPLWIPYLALPVGFGLFFLQLLGDLAVLLLGYESPFGLDETDGAVAAAKQQHEESMPAETTAEDAAPAKDAKTEGAPAEKPSSDADAADASSSKSPALDSPSSDGART